MSCCSSRQSERRVAAMFPWDTSPLAGKLITPLGSLFRSTISVVSLNYFVNYPLFNFLICVWLNPCVITKPNWKITAQYHWSTLNPQCAANWRFVAATGPVTSPALAACKSDLYLSLRQKGQNWDSSAATEKCSNVQNQPKKMKVIHVGYPIIQYKDQWL